MSKRADAAWHLSKDYQPKTTFIDPRLPIVKHTAWVQDIRQGKTFNKTPEPDNYNFAVFAARPHEIPDIVYQCWYRDRLRGGWFSMCVLQNTQETHIAHTWLQNNPWYAYWTYIAAPAIRQPMSIIQQQTYKKNTKPEPTPDERLYQMGFYQGLLDKGLDEISMQRIVGTPRELNYEPDL